MESGRILQATDVAVRLAALVTEMRELERTSLPPDLPDSHLAGARNLLHYVALRRHDIRDLQRELTSLGLSSLGRIESHVLPAAEAVLQLIQHLLSGRGGDMEGPAPDLPSGRQCLERQTERLLGEAPAGRRVRIMVTMPAEAAAHYELVRDLVASGMECMRINCAHDGEAAWAAMIGHLRRAEAETGLRCRVLMDLPGPKLRTGPMEPGPAVMKCRPQRDNYGRVTAPARLWLTPDEAPEVMPGGCDAALRLPGAWLAGLAAGCHVRFTDARAARRLLTVVETQGRSWIAECSRTVYLIPGLRFTRAPSVTSVHPRGARLGPVPPQPLSIRLRAGDRLILTREALPGRVATQSQPARISVTLPEIFDAVRPGDPIWFDDGAIGGVVVEAGATEALVEITRTSPGGGKLGPEKGVNVPETELPVPALSDDDRASLAFAVAHADLIGMSFVRSVEDVRDLRRHLAALGAPDAGVVLKIETRVGFESLPMLLLEAMRSPGPLGVMIARGDLAVECGFQRLAELQEEILWICEAAHVPAIWATQVLESLAKTGRPSRSEITDAAMGERAECVMLNKGPYIAETVRVLDDILRRMEAHQVKKTAMLRKLHVAEVFNDSNEPVSE